jgi:magnesium transporter
MKWRLVGRITIDDIIDVIRDEADQDYQSRWYF